VSSDKKKLENVKLISQAKEKELLLIFKKVEAINAERKEILRKLKEAKIKLEQEILQIEKKDIGSFLMKGEVSQVVNLNQIVKQKKEALESEIKKIEEANSSYVKSQLRLDEIEKDLLENKVDQKKYDKIIEKDKINSERIMKEIQDINTEDLIRKK